MQKMKWIFFGYLAFVALVIAGIALAFNAAPARDSGTFYSTYDAAVKTLDPAEVDDTLGSAILSPVYEALYNYKYEVHPFALYPELAATMPQVSADGLTMTIPIRHGIHYYDPEHAIWPDGMGPEITAEDFVYSFKRVCDFHLASDNYSFVFQGHFLGIDNVTGADGKTQQGWWDYTQYTPADKVDYDRPVEGFKALDRYTLQLKFTKPYPQMIYNMVNNPCSPVCRAIVEFWKDKFRMHAVGSGPYAIVENLREQRIVFNANPIYRGRPDVDGNTPVAEAERMPRIKRMQEDYFLEPIPNWLLFKQGLYDINLIPKDAYASAINGNTGDLTPELSAKGIVLKKADFPATAYIGFNMGDPILGKNKPLRQAMSLAFDRKRFIETFLNGRGTSAIGIVPPGFPTYDSKRVNPYTQYDLERAKQLMAEAEKINGGPIPPLTFLLRGTDTTSRQTGEFDAAMMKKIGITIVPVYRDFKRWQEMVDNRQTQLFDGGWSADYPDEQDYLQLLYGPNAPQGGLDSAAYVNPAFDALYDKATIMNDSPERKAIYLQMQKMVEEDCPWIITYYDLIYDLSYDWLGKRTPMDYGHGYAQYYTLDRALRSRRLSGKN
jgi:oligopeptide transport system substrate-binding protein